MPPEVQSRSDSSKIRILKCLLCIGGVMAVLDGLSAGSLPRAAIRFFASAVYLWMFWHLRQTANVRKTTLVLSFFSGMVFLGDFLLFGDPIYFAVGFSVPIFSALLLLTKDACLVLAAYGACGMLLAILLHFELVHPAYPPPNGIERAIAAFVMICAVAGPTMWMQRLLFKAERNERTQRHRFEAICDNSVSALLEADENGKITFARGQLIDKLGFKPTELIGKPQMDFVVFADLRSLWKTVARRSKHAYRHELRIRDAKGGERWVQLTGYSTLNSAGKRVYSSAIEDIHDSVLQRRHRFEIARLESLGNLCGGLAHDFNNLLTVIGIHAENVADDETRQELLRAQQQAADLTAGLLTFARKQSYREENIDLELFFGSIRKLIEQLLSANVRIHWSIARENLIVRMDCAQLQQVLMNLVNNALHAMPEGGDLTISLTKIPVPRQFDSQTDHNGLAQITVSDTGHGMDQQTVSKSIEPFFTTKPLEFGTGLGLSTAHGAVTRAGGSLTISSQPEKGTEISLQIPSMSSATAVSRRMETERYASIESKRKIMLVDDNEGVAASISKLLETWGHDVTVHFSAETALNELADTSIYFDLLISDVMLPGMNGVELANRAAESRKNIRTLLMTGYQTSNLKLVPKDTHCLAKPLRADQLQAAIANTLSAKIDAL